MLVKSGRHHVYFAAMLFNSSRGNSQYLYLLALSANKRQLNFYTNQSTYLKLKQLLQKNFAMITFSYFNYVVYYIKLLVLSTITCQVIIIFAIHLIESVDYSIIQNDFNLQLFSVKNKNYFHFSSKNNLKWLYAKKKFLSNLISKSQ